MQPVKSKSSLPVLTPLFVLFLSAGSLSFAALTPLLIPSLNLLSSLEPFCHHPASCVQFEPTLEQSRCLRVCVLRDLHRQQLQNRWKMHGSRNKVERGGAARE